MRSLAFILLLAIVTAAGAAGVMTEINPVRTRPEQAAQTLPLGVIVKLRAPTGAAARVQTGQERISALAVRTGLALNDYRPVTERMHVIHVVSTTGEPGAASMLARLRADPEVEYAEPDQRRYVHALTPNDPLYTQQWYLQVAASMPSAVDAADAWSTTTGSSIVIADIDSGVRPDHPDLAGRLLTGYCFISDSFVANGGSCPGAGATDPGDWVTQQDVSSSPHGECSAATAGPSSWHGTRVAGILGATTNNSVGVAGLTWSGQLLPVRALGKCGGDDSDIISAMLWAAGIPVSGVPINANPAKIINMSLGGSGSCPASYQDAIDQITARGVLIVVSAGNQGGPVDAPANCQGVAGVAGLRQAGTKVGYSSLGPEISLAAPAGNCSNQFTTAQSPCVYSLTTTTNLGYQQPDANDYTGEYYCDPTTGSYTNCTLTNSNQYRTYNLGTSFSAPIVSGIGALMVAVNSNLNACQLISRLQEGVQPFPQTSLDTSPQPPMCHVPTNANDIQNAECICTTDGKTCGAGMANAPGSVTAALRPIAAISLPSSVSAGQSITLDGSSSAAANSHVLSTYQWGPVSGGLTLAILGSSSSKATVAAPTCGIGTVALTVTDDAGRTDTANVVITPASATTNAPSVAGQSLCSLVAPVVQVAVCPVSSNVATGATQIFTATLANTTNTVVSWQVNGIAGGNSTVGTISSTGLYAGPATVPSPASVTVSAVSAADSTKSASAIVTITTAAAPVAVSVSPTGASVQAGGGTKLFTATVSNTSNTAVTWQVNGIAGGNSTVGSISSAGLYTAPAAVPSPASVTVSAVSVADSTKSGSASVTITPPPIAVSVSPTSASVQAGGGTQQFTATLSNTSNTAVTWQVNGIAGGNSTVGSISSAGLYTAPAAVPSPASVTVNAVSAADSTKSGSASVTITPPPIAVSVSPTSASVQASGGTQQFTATVSNSSNTAVTWQVNGIAGGNSTVGSISSAGLYTAPAAVPSPASVSVSAISAADSTKSGSASVTITPPPIAVSVSPTSASVQASGGTQQFTATVSNSSNTAVAWQVNGIAGGNSTGGTISTAGLYTAPAGVPSPASVSVSAVSAADSTKSGSASVTITPASSATGSGGSSGSHGGGGAFDWADLGLLASSALFTVARRQRRRKIAAPNLRSYC